MKTIGRLFTGKPWLRHLLFSIAVLALLIAGLAFLRAAGFRYETGQATVNCLYFLGCIYTGRWLCSYFYLRKRYLQFVMATIITLAVLAAVEFVLVKYAFHHPYAGFLELLRGDMPFFYGGMMAGMLLKLISASLRRELHEALVKAGQKESELELLRSQLSPHFLFNTLNNLYGLSLEEPKRLPRLLLELSGLLRYSLYGASKSYIPLKQEIEYIRTYIGFEQIRKGDRLVLVTTIQEDIPDNVLIAPLVLIVFVENAFKHSANQLDGIPYIELNLCVSGGEICFHLANTYANVNSQDLGPEDSCGIGLRNTLKRLELLYGADHNLRQYTKDDRYNVELQLKAKYE